MGALLRAMEGASRRTDHATEERGLSPPGEEAPRCQQPITDRGRREDRGKARRTRCGRTDVLPVTTTEE
jgi:hypothetical protein